MHFSDETDKKLATLNRTLKFKRLCLTEIPVRLNVNDLFTFIKVSLLIFGIF